MNIKDWYIKTYPEDEMGKEINPRIGFNDCWQMMKNGNEFYTIINTGDSVIRERIFAEIAKLNNITYDVVYNVWFNN